MPDGRFGVGRTKSVFIDWFIISPQPAPPDSAPTTPRPGFTRRVLCYQPPFFNVKGMLLILLGGPTLAVVPPKDKLN
jgi:hypothetical protein